MKLKIILIILSFTSAVQSLFAQYPLDFKRDNVWVFGYSSSPDQKFGNSVVDFNNASVDTYYVDGNVWYKLESSMVCDTAGSLLLQSSGFLIYDNNFEIVPDADSLNCCNDVFAGNYGYGGTNIDAEILVPLPGSDSIYYYLHKMTTLDCPFTCSPELRHTIIHCKGDSCYTTVKDSGFFTASIYSGGGYKMCRHANGRDWWFIQRNYNNHKFYVFLLDPTGIHYSNSYSFPGYLPYEYGQSAFSPDGSTFILGGSNGYTADTLFISKYDFDRCTGTLSNNEKLFWVESDSFPVSGSGLSFSPNSKFLYVSSTYHIFQFDMSSSNWQQSKTLVATYDGFEDNGWSTIFSRMQLAPDGRIYIVGGNTKYLNTIDNPDEEGLACNVSQHSFKLPSKNQRSMPNFPPYRMGPIDGSPCDTLGIDIVNNIEEKLDNNTEPVRLYPNPATDYITLFIPRITKQWQFALFDIQGREVLHIKSRGAFRSVDVSQLATGLYLWKLVYEDGKRENGKLVIQR
ncbi:MAG: T9SS type A sorting domain-containing protein [Bacteroidota bacterium]|jgi:hypothetical protein